jgi:hypothetical protein
MTETRPIWSVPMNAEAVTTLLRLHWDIETAAQRVVLYHALDCDQARREAALTQLEAALKALREHRQRRERESA